MKVTADTNVLVSATFWYGDSNRIIERVERKEIELVLSREILDEFAAVLDYKEIKDKIRDRNLEMKRTIEKIISISTIVEPKEKVELVKDDPEDNKILSCAKEGGVDYLITNDKHLLSLRKMGKILIITPRMLVKMSAI